MDIPTYVKQVKMVAGVRSELRELFNAFDITDTRKGKKPPKGAGPCPTP